MKTTLLALSLAVVLMCAICGCDQRKVDVPTNPADVSTNQADRVLAFRYVTEISGGDYYDIALLHTSSTSKDVNTDIVELVVGDSTITLGYLNTPPLEEGWYATGSHLINDNQSIILRINGNTILSTVTRPVNRASAAFPAVYDYQQPLTLNWAVSSGNQYQYVRAEAWSNVEEGMNSPNNQYVKQVGASSRSHLFPANCVSPADSLQFTTFVLVVQEINYKIVGKSAVMFYQEDAQSYAGNGSKKMERFKRTNSLALYNILTQRQDSSE
jgi:hypothetical protein